MQGLQMRKDGSLGSKFVSVAKAALSASLSFSFSYSVPGVNSKCMFSTCDFKC